MLHKTSREELHTYLIDSVKYFNFWSKQHFYEIVKKGGFHKMKNSTSYQTSDV
jgi:hypothetical protein